MKRLLQIFFHIDKTRYFEKLSENDPGTDSSNISV